MLIHRVGPVWAPAPEVASPAVVVEPAAAPVLDTPKVDDGSVVVDPVDSKAGTAFAALDEDTRGWLQTKGLTGVDALAKSARESEKLLGGMVKLPGKDATPEERDAFLNKLGRPEKADGYQFTAPKDMPEGMPYDGDKAKAFMKAAHEQGLTQAQAQFFHDWYVGEQVGAFSGMGEAQKAAMQQKGVAETEKLVKEWGPLDGETASANFEIADKVFTQVPGGQDFLNELKTLGLVGPNKEILSAPVAKMLAALGTALYTEDGVLRGKADVIGNPFDKKGASFNLTSAMKLAKEDPDRARSLITAAGLKPEEFGLKS